MNLDNLVKTVMHYLLNEKRTFLNRWKEIRKPSESKEENVGIYRRYIMYREGSTRYFVEKNRRREISAKITYISAIYRFQFRQYNGKKSQKKMPIFRLINAGQLVTVLFQSVNAGQCATMPSLQCTLKILLLLCYWRVEPQTFASNHQGKLALC